MKPDDAYESVVSKPPSRKVVQRDSEVSAEDEQVFLMKQQAQLAKTPAPGASPAEQAAPRQQRPAVARTPERSAAAPANAATPARGVGGGGGGGTAGRDAGTTEGMLANFFNSLLSNKTPGSPVGNKAAMTRDAAAELERMTRGKKTPETNPSTPKGPQS